MKRLVIAFLVIYLCCTANLLSAQEMTAKEVVAKCAEAMGGIENLQKLQTMRVFSIYPDHGEEPIMFEFKRPNLSRSAEGKLVFDGKRACWVKGEDGESEPELIDAEEWCHFEIDTAYLLPAFFDFPSELAGIEDYKDKKCYKIIATMPLGTKMEYLVDAETWLPVHVGTTITFKEREINLGRDLLDYKKVGDVLLPHGFTYKSHDDKQIKGWIKLFELNVAFEDGYFDLPKLP